MTAFEHSAKWIHLLYGICSLGLVMTFAIVITIAMVFREGTVILDFNHYNEGWLEFVLIWTTTIIGIFVLGHTLKQHKNRT